MGRLAEDLRVVACVGALFALDVIFIYYFSYLLEPFFDAIEARTQSARHKRRELKLKEMERARKAREAPVPPGFYWGSGLFHNPDGEVVGGCLNLVPECDLAFLRIEGQTFYTSTNGGKYNFETAIEQTYGRWALVTS